ncbi:HIT domain-containing protein [Candidatus Phaeomarinobacter ectocarpi]|uniref:HIT domain-containing protein n=1 Tax=Candidatus Phaeomarinibacter ectocarpi TaxID=1458461 RepID=UPI0009E026D1|nr:HIT domain-containing protein [Candidatus Phaeomarinobacter ectocarpi]
MLTRFKIPLIALVAFAIGQLGPLTWVFWQLAEWRLPQIKAESIAKPSPFETMAEDVWVAQTANAFAIEVVKEKLAPVHLLVISKERYATILDVPPEVRGEMINFAVDLARTYGVADSGFRLTTNTNPQGAQTVYHVHIHVIGGRQMGWLG